MRVADLLVADPLTGCRIIAASHLPPLRVTDLIRNAQACRDFGFTESASLGDPHTPGFERGPFCNACHQNARRLVETASQHCIPAFRNVSCPVDFTGCIAPARQADISSDASRPVKIIDDPTLAR